MVVSERDVQATAAARDLQFGSPRPPNTRHSERLRNDDFGIEPEQCPARCDTLVVVAFGAGADALIVRGDEILLGHRMDRDLWVFPGGAVDSGEAPWEAAIRESAEEVGVQASVVRLIGVAWQPGPNELIFDFLCTAVGEPKPCLEETDDVGWFPISAPPANLFRPHRERLASYVSNGWTEAAMLSTQDR